MVVEMKWKKIHDLFIVFLIFFYIIHNSQSAVFICIYFTILHFNTWIIPHRMFCDSTRTFCDSNGLFNQRLTEMINWSIAIWYDS